jgi:hypothetical protein
MPQMRIRDLTRADAGQLVIAVNGGGLKQLAGGQVQSYPIRGASNPNALLQDRDVNANKLLRDRDGGLWIGTVERGLIHVHHGRTDYSGERMASRATSSSACSRIVKAISGSPPPEDSTGFESSRSLRSPRSKALQRRCGSVIAASDGACGSPRTMV